MWQLIKMKVEGRSPGISLLAPSTLPLAAWHIFAVIFSSLAVWRITGLTFLLDLQWYFLQCCWLQGVRKAWQRLCAVVLLVDSFSPCVTFRWQSVLNNRVIHDRSMTQRHLLFLFCSPDHPSFARICREKL